MGRENPRWGCIRISGELANLGIRVSATKIRTLLRANGLGPAPRRDGPTWSQFLRSQAKGILALDFFTVEKVMLRTMYVLFAIHLGSRQVHVLGVTRNPDSAWVTQQARNLAVGERLRGIRFVIRDYDSKFSGPFDEVFRSEGMRISRRRSGLRARTRTPSGGSAPSGWSAWTGCSSSAVSTWRACFARTSSTTTRPGPISGPRSADAGAEVGSGSVADSPAKGPTHRVLGGLIREYELAA
jgi:hypothetical protein